MYEIEVLEMKLREKLTDERYNHSKNVMIIAVELAQLFNVDIVKAKIAGLLHDYAKFLDAEQIHDYIKLFNLNYDEFLLKNPYLLHGPIGSEVIKLEFNIFDKDILNAIKYHTYGTVDMTDLEKIIYIADIIEPDRDYFEGLDELRTVAYQDLDHALKLSVKYTIDSLIQENKPIYYKTIELWNSLI